MLHLITIVVAVGAALFAAHANVPAQVAFATYLGGSAADSLTVVKVGPDGDIYLAGSTRSADLLTADSLFPAPAANGVAVGFLTRIRADRKLVYSTYLPRPVVALAIDAVGNALVADHFAEANKFSGSTGDVVVSKIDATASTVLYSVRLGGRGLDQPAAIAVDSTGAVVITGQTRSADFPLLHPLQASAASLPVSSFQAGGIAFVTKLDASGRMVFSTLWGGSVESTANGVAIDGSSDIVVAGMTSSEDFVTTSGAFQRVRASASCASRSVRCGDGFVTRLSADGQTIRYSTLFGGTNGESVHALTLDAAGSPHVAGVTASADFPLKNALQTSCDTSRDIHGCSAYVAKFSVDGSSLQYSTFFGSQSYYVYGPGQVINGLSIHPSGSLIVVGTTQGNDLPLVAPFQAVNGAGPVFKSTDNGATWRPSSHGMNGTGAWRLTSGGRRSPLYAAPLGGRVFRSIDAAGSWRAGTDVSVFAVDPLTPSTVYAATTSNWLLKSLDAGETWSRLAFDDGQIFDIAVAPSSPSNVYVASYRGIHHSSNGGVTWSIALDVPRENAAWPYVQSLAIHPHDADAVFAMVSDRRILRRQRDRSWREVTSLECPANQMVFSVGLPAMVYARSCGKVWTSGDDAQSWREVGFSERTAAWMAVDPAQSHTLYVASAQNGVFRSIDRGETWTRIREPLDQDVRAILVDPSEPGTIYIGATAASNAFVARFDPAGALTFSSYLGGLQASGASVAVDRTGAIIIGGSAGRGFPLTQALWPQYGGSGDAFVARILLAGF